jgi:hypothetical protein
MKPLSETARETTAKVSEVAQKTAENAKLTAEAAKARIQDGYDPVVERHRQRSGLVQAGTFADVVRQYLDARKADFTPKTWRETKRYFETGIVRAFGKLQLEDIAPVDVTSYIKAVNRIAELEGKLKAGIKC